jgi:adenylate cyclase
LTNTGSKLLITALLILVSAVASLGLQALNLFSRIESASFDHRVSIYRSDQKIHEDVAIILIDEESLQDMAEEFGRWPWPRSAYKDLLDYFALAEAQAFAFDILFSEQQNPGDDNSSDQELVDATRKAGNAVHAMQLLFSQQDDINKQLPENFERLHALQTTSFEGRLYNDFLLPIESLYLASRDIGYLEIEPDRDGVYRRIRLFNQLNEKQVFPALSSAMVIPIIAGDNPIEYSRNVAKIGDLQIPLDGSGNFIINPYGQVTTYPAARVFAAMKQIRAGESENLLLDPEEFAGKLVFLGASAIGLLDVKATALASKEAGVFLHAYAVSNLLKQEFLYPQAYSVTVAIIIIFCCISVISVVLIPRLIIATLLPAMMILIYIFISYSAFGFGHVYPVVPVIFGIIFSLILALSYRTFREQFSRYKIRRMLGQYVSPGVLTAVIDSQDDLHAEIGSTENLTILFSDIRGFTNISETMEAEKVVDLLNIYFSEMTEIIFDHDGTLDKFIGDAIMAFWGAPVKTTDHAIKAVNSAIKMGLNLDQVNEALRAKDYPQIDIGIGVHSGNVVLGNIGSEKKLDYTVIGDSVNLASRLEGLTKVYGCPLIISEDTWKAVQNKIPCIAVDRVRVKGKQQPVNLYSPAELFQHKCNISISMQDMLQQADAAFNAYLRRDWQMAIKSYGQIGECVLTELFIHRCNQYEADEPGQEWDGVFTFTSK